MKNFFPPKPRYSQDDANRNATAAAVGAPDFDTTHVTRSLLVEAFRGATHGGHGAYTSDYLQMKFNECTAVLHLIFGKNTPETDGFVAHLLVSWVASFVFNLDLDRIESNIQPCGSPGCKCHEAGIAVVHSLGILKNYLITQAEKDQNIIIQQP